MRQILNALAVTSHMYIHLVFNYWLTCPKRWPTCHTWGRLYVLNDNWRVKKKKTKKLEDRWDDLNIDIIKIPLFLSKVFFGKCLGQKRDSSYPRAPLNHLRWKTKQLTPSSNVQLLIAKKFDEQLDRLYLWVNQPVCLLIILAYIVAYGVIWCN